MRRRQFCLTSAIALAGTALPQTSQAFAGRSRPLLDVAAIDRARVLSAANRYLGEPPVTVTSAHSDRSAGGVHDYFSEGDYWWPDPAHPSGPYIQKDGFSNPDNFNAHREALIRLSLHVPALVAAWKLTREKRYATRAGDHLRAWFVTAQTRMNPNLEHAQAISGRTTGRGIGIIDTLHLVEVARATAVMEPAGALSPADHEAVLHWFRDYLAWMTTSKNGMEERDAKNNHGTCWLLQAAEFARLTGNATVTTFARDRLRLTILPTQVAPDGSLPLELARTKPYSYCLFDLDVLATACHVLSEKDEDLWRFKTADGRGMEKAVAFMFPFIRDRGAWPFRHDVEHFEELPVRQVNLLFAGLAYRQQAYLDLWKTLNPDPTSPEIIRNFPIRQPVLWVS